MCDDFNFTRLEEAQFPSTIAALEPILELIDEMLMSYEEALLKAAGTNQLRWMDQLLPLWNGSLTDAITSASSNGYVEMVVRLLREISERELNSTIDRVRDNAAESTQHCLSTTMRRALQNAVETAAMNGQINIVSMFLQQNAGTGEDTEALHKTTWQVLDRAATHEHLNVVKFAVAFASEWGYIESYIATSDHDALTLAITGGYEGVAKYLLEIRRIKWDMEIACEKTIEDEQHELVEWFYVTKACLKDGLVQICW